jgi:hypothetical protein
MLHQFTKIGDKMYIENELCSWIHRRCSKANFRIETEENMKEILENCGIWYSFEGIRAEREDFNMSLEDCIKEYWYVIDENKILFTNPDQFSDDLDEYLGL